MANENHIETFQAWADITLKLFKRKIQDYDVWDTGDLFDSLAHHVVSQANGDVSRIEFFFNYYGRFVDQGTGKEIYVGNQGDLGFSPERKPKKWYSRIFYGRMLDLVRLVAEKYGKEASKRIREHLTNRGAAVSWN
jgi:hypothetical protein